jgi:hypothetical protein
VLVLDGKKLMEVNVDAGAGKIVDVEETTPAEEAKEKKEKGKSSEKHEKEEKKK